MDKVKVMYTSAPCLRYYGLVSMAAFTWCTFLYFVFAGVIHIWWRLRRFFGHHIWVNGKKDHWSRDIPKGVCFSWWFVENNWTVVLQPFVFVSKESYAPDENHSASHSLDGNEETGTPCISDLQTSTRGVSVFLGSLFICFLKVGASSAATSPSPSRRRQATGEEELLWEDISSLQMIEPFSFIVALARAHYSAINKSDSFDIVPPNDRALRYLFVLYKPQRWVCIAVN